DLGRLARHCVKVLLAFTLLEKRALALDGLAAYLERVPVYRQINRCHLGMAPAALAAWLASELERAGVARRSAGRPAARRRAPPRAAPIGRPRLPHQPPVAPTAQHTEQQKREKIG